MSFQKLLKIVDQRSKDSVFGYIRQSSKNKERENNVIPMMIQYCCLRYYFVNEYFIKPMNDVFEISENGKIIHKTDWKETKQASNYGNIVIDLNNEHIFIYKWKLKVQKLSGPFIVCVGIEAMDKTYYWPFNLDGHWHTKTITIELNVKEMTFKYGWRVSERGCDFGNERTGPIGFSKKQQYRLTAQVNLGEVRIEILEYQEKYC